MVVDYFCGNQSQHMILFFGTRPGKSKIEDLPNITCPHCQQTGSLTAYITSNYFHLFWIRLFKISTNKIVECTYCKRVFYREEFSDEMARKLERNEL